MTPGPTPAPASVRDVTTVLTPRDHARPAVDEDHVHHRVGEHVLGVRGSAPPSRLGEPVAVDAVTPSAPSGTGRGGTAAARRPA